MSQATADLDHPIERKSFTYKGWQTGLVNLDGIDVVGSLDTAHAWFATVDGSKIAHIKGFSGVQSPVSNVYDEHCLEFLKVHAQVLCFDADDYHRKNFTRLVPQFLKLEPLDGFERTVVAFVREADVDIRRKVWSEGLSPAGATSAKFGAVLTTAARFSTNESEQSYASIMDDDIPWRDRRFKFVAITDAQAELAAPVFGISRDMARINPYISLGIIG